MVKREHRLRASAALGMLLLALLALAAALGGTATQSAAAPTATASADASAIVCGRSVAVGFAAPITGPAASLGGQMLKWGRFAQTRWNREHRTDIRLVQGDTQLPDTAQAVRVAEGFAGNQQILAVVGPAGSQEVQVSTAPLRRGGVANISGTATATALTIPPTRRGFFFRTVPNDDQQGARAVAFIRGNLRATRVVVIDAQNSYSVGLSDTVERLLRAASGVTVQRESVNEATVSDFSSLVARIPNNTQIVYIPWQLAPKAQLFGQQLRASGRDAVLFGGDGLYDPDTFKIPGSHVTAFPVALGHPTIRAYQRGPGGGQTDLFGLPTYVAVDIAARAIEKACANRQATRAEVRRFINQTTIPKAQSLLGFPIRFQQRVQAPFGPGDMSAPSAYIVYRISPNGQYLKVG
jgi:branched-chain amino acid transport system substrate-binding protein